MTNRPEHVPLIGLTTSEVRPAGRVPRTEQSDPPRKEVALGLVYMRAVESAGGVPVVVSPIRSAAIEALLDHLDGLCLSGGPDLEPKIYGATHHPDLGPTEPEFDRFEQEVIQRADARGMPMLGICRGMQSMNVARGGTLIQHLPDVSSSIDHRQGAPGEVPTHAIEVEPGSVLADTIGATSLEVNTFHHQAPNRVGEALEVVARAPDGVIEAIEDPRRRFHVGVQWHAELMAARPPEAALFGRLVGAAIESGHGAAAGF